jgi:hypothetical protein
MERINERIKSLVTQMVARGAARTSASAQEEKSPFTLPWEGRRLFALRVPVGL